MTSIRSTTRSTVLAALALIATAALAGPAERPRVCVVPFRNLSGEVGAVGETSARVRAALERRGFTVVDDETVGRFLRERRIRARDALSAAQIEELASQVGARFVLVGMIDAWREGEWPQVGLAARLIDAGSGAIVWAGSSAVHAVEAPGLLALGRPKTIAAAADKAVRRLFDSLGMRRGASGALPVQRGGRASASRLADKPIVFRSPRLDGREGPLRVALLPLTNRTEQAEAARVIGARMLGWLGGRRDVEVVDPGELRRALIERDIQPMFGVGTAQLRELRDALGIGALLDGTVLRFDNGGSSAPRVDLYVRLRDTDSGAVLWSATTSRDGEDTRTLYDLGRIRDVDRLAEAAVADLLSTWLR